MGVLEAEPKPKRMSARKRRMLDAARGIRSAVPFSEAFDTTFADWFSGGTWSMWRVVGKAIFAEPLTPEELASFQRFTGRTLAPTMSAREVWLAVGRRGGKDWFVAALIVYLACMRQYRFKPGELGRVMLLAVDGDQADICFEYVSQLIDSIPEFARLEPKASVKYGMRRLRLNNRVEILIKPADRRRVRGRTVLACVCDEIAHWWSEERHQNPDTEVLKALRPSMLGVPGSLLIAISSPYKRKGAMFEADKKHWGKDGDRVLFWRAATWDMRPINTDEHRALYPTFEEELAEEKANDLDAYNSEYGAQYRQDLEDYLSLEQVEACVVQGRADLPCEPGSSYYLFVDTAGGGGQDSLAACITRTLPSGVGAVCRLVERKPPFDAEAVADQIAELAEEYNIGTLHGDNFSGDTWASMFRKRGLSYVVEKRTASALYRAGAPVITSKRAELPDPKTGIIALRAVNQLVNLEKREGGEKITHPQGEHDDVANAMIGALLLAVKSPAGGGVTSATTSFTDRTRYGREMDDGSRYLGGGRFIAPNGEVYRDPRYA